MTCIMDTVTAAINAAQIAATATGAAPLPAMPTEYHGGAVATPVTAGPPRTLADLQASIGVSCEFYLQASDKAGMTIDKNDDDYLAEIEGILDISENKYPLGIKYNAGGVTRYAHSYDGVVTKQSNDSWQQTVARARAMDAKCTGHYPCIEFVIELEKDLKLEKSGKVFEAGTRIGHTTSTTGTKPVENAVSKIAKEYGNVPVRVKVKHKKVDCNGYKWGICEIEVLGPAAD
jgi:hypothetical protein